MKKEKMILIVLLALIIPGGIAFGAYYLLRNRTKDYIVGQDVNPSTLDDADGFYYKESLLYLLDITDEVFNKLNPEYANDEYLQYETVIKIPA